MQINSNRFFSLFIAVCCYSAAFGQINNNNLDKMETTIIEEQTKSVIEQFYHNLAAKNFEANVQLFAENVKWHIPGNQRMATWIKDRNSRDDIKNFYKELYENLEGVSFDVTRKFYNEDQAVVTGHLVSRILSSGKLFDSYFTVQFTVENNLITEYLMLEDSYALIEAIKQDETDAEKIAIAKSYFEKVDKGDPSYLDLFTDDVEFYFPKFGITHNREGIKQFSQRFGNLIQSIKHDIEGFKIYVDGNTVIVEGKERGITKEGAEWPDYKVSQGLFCGIFTFEKGLISRYYIYVDPDFTSEDIDTIQKLKE